LGSPGIYERTLKAELSGSTGGGNKLNRMRQESKKGEWSRFNPESGLVEKGEKRQTGQMGISWGVSGLKDGTLAGTRSATTEEKSGCRHECYKM